MTDAYRMKNYDELDRLLDAELRALLELDDASILAESKEFDGDPVAAAKALRSIVDAAVDKAGCRRLVQARATLDQQTKPTTSVISWPVERKRQLLAGLQRELSDLTIAARQGSNETENDLNIILEDLVELGIIDEMGNKI